MFVELMANLKLEILQQPVSQHVEPPGVRAVPRQPPTDAFARGARRSRIRIHALRPRNSEGIGAPRARRRTRRRPWPRRPRPGWKSPIAGARCRRSGATTRVRAAAARSPRIAADIEACVGIPPGASRASPCFGLDDFRAHGAPAPKILGPAWRAIRLFSTTLGSEHRPVTKSTRLRLAYCLRNSHIVVADWAFLWVYVGRFFFTIGRCSWRSPRHLFGCGTLVRCIRSWQGCPAR